MVLCFDYQILINYNPGTLIKNEKMQSDAIFNVTPWKVESGEHIVKSTPLQIDCTTDLGLISYT